MKYSAYDRELLAIYATIERFSYLLEGRQFVVFTDHRPLTFAFTKSRDNFSPRQIRHLAYISQFTTDVRHVSGESNAPADALSRIETIAKRTISPSDIARAQKSDPELTDFLASNSTSLKLRQVEIEGVLMFCDDSTGNLRPYIPSPLRIPIFQDLHSLSHPGGRSTSRLISRRFVWPAMQRDIKKWVRQCHDCQSSKVQRHERTSLVHFLKPDDRFAHIHVDVVGPLPLSRGHTYLLTCVDRYTRWLEALPMPDQSAQTVARTFFEGWVSRFGSPVYLVTDQGRNFESTLFQEVAKILGIEVRHTTAYHPQANGLIERQHRTLKAALMCRMQTARDSWLLELPVVLLGLRSAFREDLKATPANLVYGTNLRLPGELFEQPTGDPPTHDYVHKLLDVFSKLRPTQAAWHGTLKTFNHPHLDACSHVYIRQDGVKLGLQRPYSGPYEVLERGMKTFKIAIGNRQVTVSRDRLKPAYSSSEMHSSSAHSQLANIPIPPAIRLTQTQAPQTQAPQTQTPTAARPHTITRSGRRVHFPDRLGTYIH